MKTNNHDPSKKGKILIACFHITFIFIAIQLADFVTEKLNEGWFIGNAKLTRLIVTLIFYLVFYYAAMLITNRLIPFIVKKFAKSDKNIRTKKNSRRV